MNAITITITTRQATITVSKEEAIRRLSRFTGPMAKALLSAPGQATQILSMAAKARKARNGGESDPMTRPWQTRILTRLAGVYSAEIASRGGETMIAAERSGGDAYLSVRDRQDGMTLLKAEGWRYYSRRFGSRHAVLAYLCGRDDNGRWAVRVPGTVETVEEAMEAIEPAAVKAARKAGKTILRQGDVYAIETTKAHDGKGDLPSNHRWDAVTRTLTHTDSRGAGSHGALSIPFPVRFVTQSTLAMGRTQRRGRGD